VPISVEFVRPDNPTWNTTLGLVPHDFFHTAECHHFFELTGEGQAWMAICRDGDKVLLWPYLLRTINVADFLPEISLWDIGCGYGHTGPLAVNCSPGDDFLVRSGETLSEVWRSQNVVSVFTRFHAILENHRWVAPGGFLAKYSAGGASLCVHGHIISIDLHKTAEQVSQEYKRPLRQHIRAGRARGLVTTADPRWTGFTAFVGLYGETMTRNRAEPRYFFTPDYFCRLKAALGEHGILLVTRLGDDIAAAGLFIEYGGIVTAHLAGTSSAHLQMSPGKILFDDAQIWARARGDRLLVLGGGRSSNDDDALFRFKAEFSPSRHRYYTGRWILDRQWYDELTRRCRRTSESSALAESTNDFFPAYRAPLLLPSSEPAAVPATLISAGGTHR